MRISRLTCRKLDSTLDYVSAQQQFTSTETIKEARRVVSQLTKCESFELAQLVNLMPESAAEAKSLIPSMHFRIDDDDLQSVLTELQNLKRFR